MMNLPQAHEQITLTLITCLLALLFIPMAVAAPIVHSNITVDYMTHSSARVTWWTDVDTYGELRYGLNESVDATNKLTNNALSRRHSRMLTGLPADTTIVVCPVARTSTGETSECVYHSFTTPPLPPSQERLPTLPSQLDTSVPTMNGKTWTVNTADGCNDPVDGLQATIDKAQRGDTIIIAAGAVCTGQYSLPAKTGDGWIIIRTSTPDSELPIGVRVLPADAPKLATLRTNAPWIRQDSINGYAICNRGTGSIIYDVYNRGDSSDGFRLWYCVDHNTQEYAEIPHGSGTNVPSTCSEGEWFFDTDAPDEKSRFWCIKGVYEPIIVKGGSPSEVVHAKPGASHYRLIGLELTHVPLPDNAHEWFKGTAPHVWHPQFGSSYSLLVKMSGNVHDLIIDRSYIHGQEFPSRLSYGVIMASHHTGILDSYFDNIAIWDRCHYCDKAAMAIQVYAGPGPMLIQNNYLNTAGITLFGQQSEDNYNVTVRRNHFDHDPRHWQSGPDGGNYTYSIRTHLELKAGRRWLIEKNIFDFSWAAIQQGPAMTFTPRVGYGPQRFDNDWQISDITIRDNIIRNVPTVFNFNGALQAGTHTVTKNFERLLVENNLVYNVLGNRFFHPYGNVPNGAAGAFAYVQHGLEDVTVRHNTYVRSDGTWPHFFWTNNIPGSGFTVTDNIIFQSVQTRDAISSIDRLQNDPKNFFSRSYPDPDWTFAGNVLFGTSDNKDPYPAGNTWTGTEQDVGFIDPDNAHFALAADSPFAGKATDGTNPGVDWSRLMNAVSGVDMGSPPRDPTPYKQPPLRYRGSPSGTIPQPPAEISLYTDVAANCFYATTPGTGIDAMTKMDAQGTARIFAAPISVANGTHEFYVKCKSWLHNIENTDDYVIEFTVGESEPAIGSPYDLDGDGIVDIVDVEIMVTYIHAGDLEGDFNADGSTNIMDMLELVSQLS